MSKRELGALESLPTTPCSHVFSYLYHNIKALFFKKAGDCSAFWERVLRITLSESLCSFRVYVLRKGRMLKGSFYAKALTAIFLLRLLHISVL